MDKVTTLKLLDQGKEAWNAWAQDLLAMRHELEASGNWSPDPPNHQTRSWLAEAKSDFSNYEFRHPIDLGGFIFPGEVNFYQTTFLKLARFEKAAFQGGANFRKCNFTGEASFRSAKFNGVAIFVEGEFCDEVDFEDASFRSGANFSITSFRKRANFGNGTFGNEALFIGSKFSRSAEFFQCRFEISTWFDDSVFSNGATFSSTRFLGETFFQDTRFLGTTSFEKAVFSNFTVFTRSSFAKETSFRQASFIGLTAIEDVSFEGPASFGASDGKSAFSLSGSIFYTVPDFIQAHFAEAPRLDNIAFQLQKSHSIEDRAFSGNPVDQADLSARWRALKRLAIQGHDHEREQLFFKNELLARRWVIDRIRHPIFWFSLAYQALSDFGGSLLRPIAWWLAALALFWGCYFTQSVTVPHRPLVNFEWTSIPCAVGPGEVANAAFSLSLQKGLPFIGFGSNDKLNQIYACLYGAHSNNPAMPGEFPASFTPVIPTSIAISGMVQHLFSTVLIFLFLLAIRNKFRIR